MSGTDNLKHKLTVEEARKGGRKSAEVRKRKKAIKDLLNDFLESDCKDNPVLSKLALKLGLSDEDSIKEVFTVTCLLNTVKKGSLYDLKLLQDMLGESDLVNMAEEVEDDPLTKSLMEEAKRMEQDDGNQ